MERQTFDPWLQKQVTSIPQRNAQSRQHGLALLLLKQPEQNQDLGSKARIRPHDSNLVLGT